MSQSEDATIDDWSGTVDPRRLAYLWQLVREHRADVLTLVRTVLADAQELAGTSEASADDLGHAAEDVFRMLGESAVGELGPIARAVATFGARCASNQVALRALSSFVERTRMQAASLLVRAARGDASRLEPALAGLLALFDRGQHAITAQHFAQLEQRLSADRRSADEALVRFKRLTECGLLGTMVCDVFGKIVDANDTLLTMLGYTREELLSGSITWWDLTPHEWRHLDERAVEQLRVHGRAEVWEKEYLRKDGSRVPILVGVAQLLEPSQAVAFILDISERKRAEAIRVRSIELESENQRVHEASRLKSEFLANMSHELRTPLNSIIGFADLLYDGEIGADTPEHREFIGDILKSGRHLLQLINDVLDLAKVEAGHMTFRPERLDLNAVFGEVLDVLRALSTANEISVSYEVVPEVSFVFADAGKLKQILYNYLSNALKFTGPGGKVMLRAMPEGDHCFRIEVEDTGVGIRPSDIGRLFVEFQQLEPGSTKRHAGTGLGLALTKRIVEAQGGSVGVRSTEGVGSTFWATFPCTQQALGEPTFVTPEHFEGAPLVLVVEDDAHEAELIAQTLNRARYSVELARTAQEAITACEQRTFDGITLDLLLPDGTGLQVLQAIRLGVKNRHTPVLVLSMVADKNAVHGFMVHDYLAKPVDGARLLASLAAAGVMPEKHGAILVVDDDRSALKLIQMTLGRLGFSFDCYLDAKSALESIAKKDYVAVILDLLMPGMDGFEFLAHFRSDPRHAQVPVLVWTTKDLTVEDNERLRRHAQAVFAKGSGRPISLAEQLQTILSKPSAQGQLAAGER